MAWSATSSMKTSGTLVTTMPALVAAVDVDRVAADAAAADDDAVLEALDDGRVRRR